VPYTTERKEDRIMGREITKRYLSPSGKKKLRNPFSFIWDVYKSGKSREFISFMVWEVFHKTEEKEMSARLPQF
jgi:hypothetical protein